MFKHMFGVEINENRINELEFNDLTHREKGEYDDRNSQIVTDKIGAFTFLEPYDESKKVDVLPVVRNFNNDFAVIGFSLDGRDTFLQFDITSKQIAIFFNKSYTLNSQEVFIEMRHYIDNMLKVIENYLPNVKIPSDMVNPIMNVLRTGVTSNSLVNKTLKF